MFGFYQDGTYSERQLRRNRVFILAPTLLIVGVGFVLVALGRYGLDNFSALLVLVVLFASSMWWAIGSKASGPAKVDPTVVDYFRRLMKPKPKDL